MGLNRIFSASQKDSPQDKSRWAALSYIRRSQKYFDDRLLPPGLTYSAYPVACGAAKAVTEVYEDERFVENATLM